MFGDPFPHSNADCFSHPISNNLTFTRTNVCPDSCSNCGANIHPYQRSIIVSNATTYFCTHAGPNSRPQPFADITANARSNANSISYSHRAPDPGTIPRTFACAKCTPNDASDANSNTLAIVNSHISSDALTDHSSDNAADSVTNAAPDLITDSAALTFAYARAFACSNCQSYHEAQSAAHSGALERSNASLVCPCHICRRQLALQMH